MKSSPSGERSDEDTTCPKIADLIQFHVDYTKEKAPCGAMDLHTRPEGLLINRSGSARFHHQSLAPR